MSKFSEDMERLKREHPHITDEKIAQGLAEFEEQSKVIEDCINEIDRAVKNALKIGQNLKFAPEPYAALLASKILDHSSKFQKAINSTLLESLIDVKKRLYFSKLN